MFCPLVGWLVKVPPNISIAHEAKVLSASPAHSASGERHRSSNHGQFAVCSTPPPARPKLAGQRGRSLRPSVLHTFK